MKQFLNDIKVVGFETAGAGPAASKLLAEYGAEVVMIEPVHGINTRTMRSFDYLFLHKKSIAVNMKTREGLEAVHRLLEDADVFVTNYRKRAVDKFGLDYETLHQKYPKLIHASLTGYGEHGPMKDAPGFDVTAYWARTGLAGAMQEKGGSPVVMPFAVGDIGAGTILAGGIMGALYHRERTGEAMKVYISLYGTGIYQNEEQLFWSQCGYTYPQSRLTPRRAHANSYVLKDGYFQFHTLDPDRDMPKVMRIIGREDLIEDPEFKGRWADPGEHRIRIREVLDEGFKNMTMAEAEKAFEKEDVAFGKVCLPQDVIKDPQAEANQLLFQHKTFSGDEVYMANTPLKFMDDTPCPPAPAPRCGEHSVEILLSCGYSPDEINELIDKGIVSADGKRA